MFSRTAFVFAHLILLTSVSAQVIPAGHHEYDLLYDQVERHDALTTHRFDSQLGPYKLTEIPITLGPFSYLNTDHENHLTIFAFGGERFRTQESLPATAFESIRGGIVARPLKNLSVYGQFVLDEQRADNPEYTGKKWRGLAGDVEDAYAVYSANRVDLTVGRFGSFWGPRESLVLGSDQKLDGLAYTLRWGRLRLSYRLARLNPLHTIVDSTAVTENRYFAGHRLDVHLSDNLRVGAFETIIFGGEGRQIEFAYLNPILFYHGTQLNDSTNDNALVGFDFNWKPLAGLTLYGQLLIDDWQIDNKSQGDQEPNEFGLLVGGYAAEILAHTDCKFSYSRITNRTYNQILSRNRYTDDGRLLSSALGNDYDEVKLETRRWFGPLRYARVRFSYLRQGEASINDPWTQPWLEITGSYDEPFPTGVVASTASWSIGGRGVAFGHLSLDIDAGLMHVTNDAHVEGSHRTNLFATINLSLFGFTSIAVD